VREFDEEVSHQNIGEFRKELTRGELFLIGGNFALLVLGIILSRRIEWWMALVAVSAIGSLWLFRSVEKRYMRSFRSIAQENDSIRLNLKNARLSALVSQLNPHFLFNALQLLQDEIANGTKENSCRIVQSLSNMFRYSSFNTEAMVRLQEEMQFAKDYLSICEQVYEGNLTAEVQVPERLLDYTVPKFILQPLLENSIRHGFDSAPHKNTIRLTVREEQGILLMNIADDGKGVSDQQLQAMREALQSFHSENKVGGIGLRNVHQRIRLICGDSYGVSIEAGASRGLSVTLRLPQILK
jgi:Putative regulator of cell autolysis